jgi:hypothetical protein
MSQGKEIYPVKGKIAYRPDWRRTCPPPWCIVRWINLKSCFHKGKDSPKDKKMTSHPKVQGRFFLWRRMWVMPWDRINLFALRHSIFDLAGIL